MGYLGVKHKEYKPNDELYTPPWVFETLAIDFDLDVCSPVLGLPYLPAKKWFHAGDDGLAQKWQGRVWCNPPYSSPKLWVEKFIEHNNGIMLAPFSKSAWYHKLWNSEAGIVPMPVNMKFLNLMGEAKSIFLATALYAFGAESIKAVNRIGKAR